MSQVARSILRGFARQHPTTEWWDAESGEYSAVGVRLAALPTAGNIPGVPVPQTETDMVLEAVGSQSRNKEHRILTQRGGFADGDGATFLWTLEGEDYRGWDVPNSISAWEHIVWTSTAASSVQFPHAITTPNDKVICVASQGTLGEDVSLHTRSVAGVWTSDTAALDATTTEATHPCLVPLPSGRILLFYWVEDDAADTANIRMEYNDDELVTSFQTAQAACLPVDIDIQGTSGAGAAGYDLGRIRAAYSNGQILLVVQLVAHNTTPATRDIFVQYASSDLGASFTLVETWDATLSGAGQEVGNYQDIVVVDGSFYFFYLDGINAQPYVRKITNAYEPLRNATAVRCATTEVWGVVSAAPSRFTDGDLAAWRDEAGNLYVTGRQPTVTNGWIVVRSTDGGNTWTAMGEGTGGTGTGKWSDTSDVASYPYDACATWQRGRALVLHSFVPKVATTDESFVVSYLGGSTTVTLPSLTIRRADIYQVTYDYGWFPYDLPTDVGWTASGAGSGVITTGRLVITTAALATRFYDRNPTGTIAQGCIVEAAAHLVSGQQTGLQVRLADGTNGYACQVAVDSTSITATDTVSSTQIGTASHGATGSGGVQIKVAMQDNNCTIWFRPFDTGHDREWTQLGQRLAMSDSGAAAANNRVRFGNNTSPGGVESQWRYVQYVFGANSIAADLASGQANPEELLGRPYSSIGTFVDDGLIIKAVDGPTQGGDLWHIDTQYTHPTSNLLPSSEPSPDRVWRSGPISEFNASTAFLHLAWRIDSDGDGGNLDQDSGLLNDLLAFFLQGLNCAGIYLDLYYGGAWNNVTQTGVHQFAGTRKGNVVRPTSSSTFGGLWRAEEAAGAGVGFYSVGYTVADWTGTIESNTEGITNTNGVTSKTPSFLLADPDSASASSPSVGIWPRRSLTIIHPSGYARDIKGFRIRIPVTAAAVYPGRPAAGYYEIAKVFFGHVEVFGSDYSWDRQIRLRPNTELSSSADGTRRSRVLGPALRDLKIGWADGVLMTNYREETAPDYVKGSANAAAEPVAFVHDLPYKLQDLVRSTDGADELLLYIPYIAYDSSSTSSGDKVSYTQNWANGVLYGRLTSDVEITQVVGDDEVDDMYRVTEIEFSEEG